MNKKILLLCVLINAQLIANYLISADTTCFDARVWQLIDQMTLEEKTQQINTEYLAGIERLGIPLYEWHNEALHGLVSNNVTVFPVSISLAATFNPDLIRKNWRCYIGRRPGNVQSRQNGPQLLLA